MKSRVWIILIVCMCLLTVSCAKNRSITINGNTTKISPYGLYAEFFDKSQKDPRIEYELSVGNVILSVIFSETIIVPVILCGWYLWEPVGVK